MRACPQHGFSDQEIFQTFYQGLSERSRQQLNALGPGLFIDLTVQEAKQVLEGLKKDAQLFGAAGRPVKSAGSADMGMMAGMKDTTDRLVNRMGSMEVAVEKLAKPVQAVQGVAETYCLCCGGGDHISAVCPLANVGEYEQQGDVQEVQYVQPQRMQLNPHTNAPQRQFQGQQRFYQQRQQAYQPA